MSSDFIYEVKNHVAYMTINRPEKRNALSAEVVQAFLEYMDKAEADKDVRAICITGAGEKAFCAGAELGASAGAVGEERLKSIRDYAELLKKMSQTGKPILARVAGHCMAGGLGLMLSCDIVIAKSGVMFGAPEINVGLWPMMIGALLFRHLPRKQAWYLAYSGKRITAAEGKELGMVTKVVEEDRFENEVKETLAMLCSKVLQPCVLEDRPIMRLWTRILEMPLIISAKVRGGCRHGGCGRRRESLFRKKGNRYGKADNRRKRPRLHKGGDSMSKDKAIVTCALTGVLTNPEQHPVPVTPEKMAEATEQAFNAGATIVHCHFRDQRPGLGHLPTWDPDIANDIISAIRDRVPEIIINCSTGIVGSDISGPLACLERIKPEMAALNSGSLNYLKTKKNGEWAWPPHLFDNPVEKIQKFLDVMKKLHIVPECECFDTGIVRSVGLFEENGMLEPPFAYL